MLHNVFNDMTEEFFFFKSHMGTPLDFTHKKKPVTGLGIFGRSDQKKFRYDGRSHDMIRSDRKN